MTHSRTTGEPYELAGKRLVFTSWYYIRPGQFVWQDAQGRNVSVAGDQGPWEANFHRRDYPHGIRLVAQPAERMGPILERERPWESKGVTLSTLIQAEGLYRAWGSCSALNGPSHVCYFESTNGLTWQRPALNQVGFEGRSDNNLLATPGGTVFYDPSAPAEERYKWVDLKEISRAEYEAFRRARPDAWEHRADRPDVQQVFALRGAVSPDGLHWATLPEPLVVEHSDTQPVCYYDVQQGKYVLYTRNWMVGPRSPRAPQDDGMSWLPPGRRSIGRSESANFRHFPLSEVILEPGPELLPSDVLYTNGKTTIPGAPDQHLLFPTIWHTSDDTTSISLASSHDGRLWHWLPGAPVLSTAPFGAWDGGCIFAHPNLAELPDGRWVLPYTGYLFPHKYPRGQLRFAPGYAVWPHGRLVALEAVDWGEFATVALMPPGRTLHANLRTRRVGSVRIEVADLNGQPLPGRSFAEATPLAGDQPHIPVTWQGQNDLGHAEGQPLILRFRMEQAQLFGLEFA